jgi:hypothetical protein
LKYFTYQLVPALAPNYKQHILLPAEDRKMCYSLAEMHVKYLYILEFIRVYGGATFMKHFKRGAQAIKFGNLCSSYCNSPFIILPLDD